MAPSIEERIHARLEIELKYVLAPLDNMDTSTLVRDRLCLITAGIIDDTLDTLIVLNREDLAMQYARRGLELVTLAIDNKEGPASGGRKAWSRAEVEAIRSYRLHRLSWMVNGVEDVALLSQAVECGLRDLEAMRARRSRYVKSCTKGCVRQLARLGRFEEANSLWDKFVSETGRPDRVTALGTVNVWNANTFIPFILEALAHVANMTQASPLRELFTEFFDGYEYEQRPVRIDWDDALWLAYMAGKFVEPFCNGAFTRQRIIGQLRFGSFQ